MGLTLNQYFMLLKTLQTKLNAKNYVNFERIPKERHFLQGEELPERGKVDGPAAAHHRL
jgi:hypothetical protein